MFDTSVIKAHAIAGPRRVTLLISFLIHSTAVVAAIALTLASTQLPAEPPRQLELFRPAVLPSAPPPPLGHPAVRPAQQQTLPKPRTAVAPPLTAPLTIPEQMPIAPDPGPSTGPATTETSAGDNGPIGSPLGVPNGVGNNEASAGPGIASGPYTPGGAVTRARVLARVEPRFPAAFAHGVRSAIVVVRCVIGQDGTIREPEIITSSFPPFNEAVLSALRQWKFAPGVMHGQPVDTWFELTVNFHVR